LIPGFAATLAGLLGACVGSFLNVVIWRLPRGESLSKKASHCPRCGHAIRWSHNVPVLGWLMLRGRCADCRAPISPRYPIVEALGALLFLAVHAVHPLDAQTALFATKACVLSALLAVGFIDWDQRIIPDRITKPGIALGCLAALVIDGWGSPGFLPELQNRHFAGLLEAGANAALGALLLLSVRWVGFLLLKKEGMGLGDVKLLAMIGAFTQWPDVLYVLFLASVGGAVLGGFLVLARRSTLAPVAGTLGPRAGGATLPFARARIVQGRSGPARIGALLATGEPPAVGSEVALSVTLPADTVWADDGKDVRLDLEGTVRANDGGGGGRLVSVEVEAPTDDQADLLRTFTLHRSSIPFGIFLALGAVPLILYADQISHFVVHTWPRLITGRGG